MEIKVISQEMIKPSIPTPINLRTFNLSLLDQLIPAPFAPLTLFYRNDDHTPEFEVLESKIKKSLSEVLTRFYPLGGKIRDELSIDCDDVGAKFIVAKVDFSLDDLLKEPELRLMDRFLPCVTSFAGSVVGDRVANIQLTGFGCGGISLGFCISHKIFDGSSLSCFVLEWANASLGLNQPVRPSFVGSDMFYAEDLWLRELSMESFGRVFKMGRSVTRRFLFKASGMRELMRVLKSRFTRIEAVSALLWKCFMMGSSGPCVVSHVVNLRKRFEPPLSNNTIGNFIWFSTIKSSEMDMDELGCRISEGFREINGEFLRNFLKIDKRNQVIVESLNKNKDNENGAKFYGFTSWCNFKFYEADFGWGKPIWISTIGSECRVFMNMVVLMDTRDGDIEAWVTLDEEEMALLEANNELLTYASIDVSPLQ